MESSIAAHKSKYLASINGPILFTAPHSGKLKRGGAEYGDKRRTHLREKYTNAIALKLASDTSTLLKDASTQKLSGKLGSFSIWSKDHKLNEVDLDPNYLTPENMHESPFHRMLHAFQAKNEG